MKIENMEFEAALAELEKIAEIMNEGKLSIKEAAKLYENGLRLKNHCAKILESIELKLNQISINQDGTVNIENKEESEL